MVINVAHTKGGVGKSTIATNLAVIMNVPIFDLDIQKSSYYFNELRKNNKKPALVVYPGKTEKDLDLLDEYAENPKKHIIIDSGGMDNDLHRIAVLISDLIITPVGISQVELLGLENFYNILDKSKIDKSKDFVLLNDISMRSIKDIAACKELIKNEFKLNLFKTTIGTRKLFKDAFAEGKSVVEKNKNSLASEEIRNLVKEIKSILKIGRRKYNGI